jgi:hypothetical protein
MFSACGPVSNSDAVVFASGADLESANPLVTIHPLARQVQRHALFVTLTRLDSALVPQPYFARRWEWSLDRRRLTMHLFPAFDGMTARSRRPATWPSPLTRLAIRPPGFPASPTWRWSTQPSP